MDFVINIFKGILELVSVGLVLKTIEYIFLLIINRRKYSINGFWISQYESAFGKEICANDIVEIHSLGNRLIITFQQYYNKSDGINIFQGEGYISSNGCISVSYFSDNDASRHVGCMILAQIDLKSTKKALKGRFFEFDTRDGIKSPMVDEKNALKLYDIDYVLIKYNLNLKEKIKFYLKKPVYKNHNEIKNKFEGIVNGS